MSIFNHEEENFYLDNFVKYIICKYYRDFYPGHDKLMCSPQFSYCSLLSTWGSMGGNP